MFGTQNADSTNLDKAPVMNFVGYGIHKMAVIDYEIKEAGTGSKQVLLKFETPKVTEAGFNPDPSATRGGKVGKAAFGPWLKTEEMVSRFNEKVDLVAKKLGVETEVAAISASNIEDYMKQLLPLIKGKDAYWKLKGSEYQKSDGSSKPGIINEVHLYSFIKGLDEVESIEYNDKGEIVKVSPKDPKQSTMTFNKANKHDYEKLEASEEQADVPAEPTSKEKLF